MAVSNQRFYATSVWGSHSVLSFSSCSESSRASHLYGLILYNPSPQYMTGRVWHQLFPRKNGYVPIRFGGIFQGYIVARLRMGMYRTYHSKRSGDKVSFFSHLKVESGMAKYALTIWMSHQSESFGSVDACKIWLLGHKLGYILQSNVSLAGWKRALISTSYASPGKEIPRDLCTRWLARTDLYQVQKSRFADLIESNRNSSDCERSAFCIVVRSWATRPAKPMLT